MLSLTLAGALAAAQDPAAPLAWRAPPGCPDADAVAAMTADLLRRRSGAPRPRLTATAVVTRAGDRFHLTLDLRSPDGDVRRGLAASDCRLLARAAALLVAVHLDPLAVSQLFTGPADPGPPPDLPPETGSSLPLPPPDLPPGTAHARPSDLPPGTAPARPSDLPPGTAATPPSDLTPGTALPDPTPPLVEPAPAEIPFGGHLRLEGGLDAGVLPGLGGDLGLVGGVGAARWRVDLGLVGVPRRSLTVDGTTARFDRLAGLVRGCAVWRVPPRRDRVALLGCLGLEVGALRGTTTAGVADPNPVWVPWGGALVGGAARIALLGPVGLWLGVEAVIALARPTFTAGPAQASLFRLSPAGVRANFGFDIQIVARKRRPPTTH